MEIDPELMQAIVTGLLAVAATVATWAAKTVKTKLLQVLEDLKVSEEQADMLLDEADEQMPEDWKPYFRTLRSKWDDPVVTTPELQRVIDAMK